MKKKLTSKQIRNGEFTVEDMKNWFEENNISFAGFELGIKAKCNEVENAELKDKIKQAKIKYGIEI